MSDLAVDLAPRERPGRSVPEVSGLDAGMLFAHLQLQAPLARSFLVTGPRDVRRSLGVASGLARAVADTGLRARLIDLSGRLNGAVSPADDQVILELPADGAVTWTLEAAREILAAFDGLTVVVGCGVLVDPSTLVAARAVDGVVVVVERGITARLELDHLRAELERAGGRIVGAILVE